MFGKLLQKVSLLGDEIVEKTSETAKNIDEGVSNIGKKAVELKNEVSTSSVSVEPSDILNVKTALEKVGSYKKPEWGMTDFTDNQMFDGIKNFQKDNGLKIDGVMKPDGETVGKLNEVIAQNNDFDWSKFPNKEKIPEYQDKIIKEKYDEATDPLSKVYKKGMGAYTKKYRNEDSSRGDMARNYRELVAKDTSGADKYYHAKAHCEAAQRGKVGVKASKSFGKNREILDKVKGVLFQGKTIEEVNKDSIEDIQANEYGRSLGVKFPKGDCGELVKGKYKYNGM